MISPDHWLWLKKVSYKINTLFSRLPDIFLFSIEQDECFSLIQNKTNGNNRQISANRAMAGVCKSFVKINPLRGFMKRGFAALLY
jgi:hypothetical protein